MTSFTRYVLRQLIVGMVLVTAGLTCILWLTQSLRFVEMIVNQGVSAGTFLYLTMLKLPEFLTIILPIALFCVTLFIYSKLVSDRELVVMRAAGLSQVSLAKPAVILALIVVGIGYSLNFYLMPNSYRMFRDLQWEIRNYSHILLKEGAFTSIAGVTVYIRERTKDGQLHGILAYDQRNPDKIETWMAAKGAMVESDDGPRVVMFNGNRQVVDPKTNQFSILYFDQGVLDLIDLGAGTNTPKQRYREARERGLSELLNIENEPNVSKRDIGKFTIEAHKRITSPLTALGFTLIALCVLVLGSFSRRSQSKQIAAAILIMIGLVASSYGLENTAARRLNLIPLLYVHAILPIFICTALLFNPFAMRRIFRKTSAAV
ncbi:MAG: LPS export ABC transporter permease LptF [Rhodospirillales bacterium]|nr:LPS export ABC transporter permease LptF [Rhodospirillales bacterium]